jgi:hypothetical protein
LKNDERNCVPTTDQEKKIILDAIQLINQSEEHSLLFTSIEYKKYRGFFTKLENSDTMVVFGHPPFEKQFSRLARIIEESKNKKRALTNIEVDYSDKAFIKESRQ